MIFIIRHTLSITVTLILERKRGRKEGMKGRREICLLVKPERHALSQRSGSKKCSWGTSNKDQRKWQDPQRDSALQFPWNSLCSRSTGQMIKYCNGVTSASDTLISLASSFFFRGSSRSPTSAPLMNLSSKFPELHIISLHIPCFGFLPLLPVKMHVSWSLFHSNWC